MFDFTGKRVLVTGGARGIGAATSLAFRAAGARVAIGARTQTSYDTFAAQHGSENIAPAIGDVRTRAACHDIVAQAFSALGGIDVLVNSAGIYVEIPIADIDETHWTDTMATNCAGTFFCSQAALPALTAANGNIVNLGSDAGLVGMADAVAYSAAKGAVVNLTRAMAVSLAKSVRVNCVCPGYVWTDMVEHMAHASKNPETYMTRASQHSPMQRMARPEEIASAILYLASDAAKFINGAILPVDGGGLAGY